MKTGKCRTCRKRITLNKDPDKALVMFVGLSSKPGAEPLCSSTNSGKLISEIEQLVSKVFSVYKTNLVKCAPLDTNGKLRYPTSEEMKSCLPHLLAEINHYQPKVIIPLGGQVAKFMLGELMSNPRFSGFSNDFCYETIHFNGHVILPIHHPSYVWIYRRKRIAQYIGSVSNLLLESAG